MAPSRTLTEVMVGFSWSMEIPPTVTDPVLPARSVTVRATDWPPPFPLSVTSSGQAVAGTPEPADPLPAAGSEQAKCTVTGLVYQLFDPRVPPVIVPVMAGAVRSSLIVTESVPVFPAASRADPSIVRPAVSSLPSTSGVTEIGSTPDPASSSFAMKCTVTLELFHSSALGAGVVVCVTAGAMLSHFNDSVLADSTLPALSTAQNCTVPVPVPSSGTLTVLAAPAATCSAPPSIR